jgi:hypothetical protein
MSGLSASAFVTITLVLSGMTTANTPPNKAHAASHASIAVFVVSAKHG